MRKRSIKNAARRTLSLVLCLCMAFSGLALPAYANDVNVDGNPKNDTDMRVIVGYWHPGENEKIKEYTIKQDDKPNFPISATDGESGYDSKNEAFAGFSVSAGQSAVTIERDTATVTYDPNVHLVKVHVFYKDITQDAGMDFGSAETGSDPETDTRKATSEDVAAYEKDNPESSEIEEGTKLYNTADGLHTDKTATAADDGRTFDVTLESWFAGQDSADVGLVLDASGSMAFTSANAGLTEVRVSKKSMGDSVLGSTVPESGTVANIYKEEDGEKSWLSNEQVLQILDKHYTDNSALGYSDYTYYIFDSRDSTQEYVPLGYYDPEAAPETDVKPIGQYSFEGDLKNAVEEKTPGTIIDKAADGKFAGTNKSGADASNSNYYSTSGGLSSVSGKYLVLHKKGGTGGIADDGAVKLGTTIPEGDYTISFAVKGIKRSNETWEEKGIVYITDLDDPDSAYYSITRGQYTSSHSQSRLRLSLKGAENAINTNAIFDKDEWHVVTYVYDAKSNQLSYYLDGEAKGIKDSELNTNNGVSLSDTQTVPEGASIILGDVNNVSTAPDLYLDELYVYDKALTPGQVKDLYNTVSGKSTEVADDKTIILPSGASVETDTEPLEGWYYVNSSSDIQHIVNNEDSYSSAKSFKGLPADGTPYWLNDDQEQKVDVTTSTPCQFYLENTDEDDYYTLHCLFSTGTTGSKDNKRHLLWDSVVLYKPDQSRIKAEDLQAALGEFAVELNEYSPKSMLSAVRFSTDNYVKEGDSGVSKEEGQPKLLLQDWTSELDKSLSIMNLQRGDGVNAIASDGSEYNYVLTGGTFMYTGLEAFTELLSKSEAIKDDNANKYLIVFTDGKDNTLSEDNGTKAISDANALKAAGYTIYCIMLTGGASTADEAVMKFLGSVSSATGDASKYSDYVFVAENDDALQAGFDKILGEISYDLDGYTVQDYIDPRFDLVDADGKVIHLHKNGMIAVDDGPEQSVGEGFDVTLFKETEPADEAGGTAASTAKAKLCYDLGKELYYLRWLNQTIPGCSVAAPKLNVWRSTVTLRAKDDFLGGNAVLTNGNDCAENYVYHPADHDASSGTDDMYCAVNSNESGKNDSYPSKGFPRTTVNVAPKETKMEDVLDVRYLGETFAPAEAARALLDRNSRTDLGEGFDPAYFDFPQRYAAWTENTEREYKTYDEFLKALVADMNGKKEGVTLPYSYLDAVGEGAATQSGTTAHRKDALGTLTYKLEAVDKHGILEDKGEEANPDGSGSFQTKSETYRQYKLTVTYTPYDTEGTETSLEKGYPKRAEANDALVVEEKEAATPYHTPKDPVGERVTDTLTANGTHTTYFVHGELALRVEARKAYLESLLADKKYEKGITVVVDVTKEGDKPEAEPQKLTVTITKDMLETAEDAGGGYVTFYTKAEKDSNLTVLSQGNYTLTLAKHEEGKDNNDLFATIDPVENGYKDHFTLEKADGDGVIPEGDNDNADDFIAPHQSSETHSYVEFQLGAEGAPAGKESWEEMAQELEAWLKTWQEKYPGKDDPDDTADPTKDAEGYKSLAKYLNARLGMAEVGAQTLAPVHVSLSAKKTLENGEKMPSLQTEHIFDFTITPDNANDRSSDPIRDELKNFATYLERSVTVSPVNHWENELDLFTDWVYTKPGTYKYKVQEVPGTELGLKYDETVRTVTVEVTEDTANGCLKATVTVQKGEEGDEESLTGTKDETAVNSYTYKITDNNFNNAYDAGELTISKTVEDLVTDEDKNPDPKLAFTFELTIPALADRTVKGTRSGTPETSVDVVFDKDGKATIGGENITLKNGESITLQGIPTDVTYTVTEQHVDGYVLEGGQYTRTGTIGSEGKKTETFTNNFVEVSNPAAGSLTKTLEGRNFESDDVFYFHIQESDADGIIDPEKQPHLPDNTIITLNSTGFKVGEATTTIDSSGLSNWNLTFTEAGDYYFIVHEENMTSRNSTGKESEKPLGGMTYSSEAYQLWFHVEEDAGTLKVTTSYRKGYVSGNVHYFSGEWTEGQAALAFTNTYNASQVAREFVARKVLDNTTGADLSGTEFTFTLTPIGSRAHKENDGEAQTVKERAVFRERERPVFA